MLPHPGAMSVASHIPPGGILELLVVIVDRCVIYEIPTLIPLALEYTAILCAGSIAAKGRYPTIPGQAG